jgi:hypothetical protein
MVILLHNAPGYVLAKGQLLLVVQLLERLESAGSGGGDEVRAFEKVDILERGVCAQLVQEEGLAAARKTVEADDGALRGRER